MSDALPPADTSASDASHLIGQPVPETVVARGWLPPMQYRDLPEPVPLRRMIGPSVMLAGLALGSGEFVLWPHITYKVGFLFFWACMLGVATQYFINMEVTRWALATGESAVTGFSRLNRNWAWVFLILNIVPWIIPAWAVGAAEITSWLFWGPTFNDGGQLHAPNITPLAIGSLVVCGLILTAGPVIYETVERVQLFLVGLILILVVAIACLLVRPDVMLAAAQGAVGFQVPKSDILPVTALLGAIAFAGAGGTLNLGQSNYVKEKGYGMGQYIGRITSPITGKEEAVVEIGYHFPTTPANMDRWHRWWRAANWEHFFSFFVTCVVCLLLLSAISYSIFYTTDGQPTDAYGTYASDMGFIWGQARALGENFGGWLRLTFLVMGVAILLTTEFGVLDAASRISTDIVKVNYLRENTFWSESRLYYVFLWGTIAAGAIVMSLIGADHIEGLAFFRVAAAMNGAVMFLYSGTLLYLNRFHLPPGVRMGWFRTLMMIWAVAFFGFFAVWAGWSQIKALL